MFAPPPPSTTPPASASPPVVQEIVAERVPRAAPDLGLRAGELIISFRLDHRAAEHGGHLDARVRVRVSGLGGAVGAEKAPFSTKSGRCLDAHAPRVLRHWKKGRQVTVTIRTGNAADGYANATRRVRVVPFNLGDSEQAYATTMLDCFSMIE